MVGRGRDEAHGDQMPLAHGLLEGVMELGGTELLALFQVGLHEGVVHLHDLVNDLGVGLFHRGEIRADTVVRLEKAVRHPVAALGGQVDGQTLGAEVLLQIGEHLTQVRARRIDLADDDHAAQALILGLCHDLVGDALNTRGGVHDHGGGLHGRQHADGTADEIRQAGRVDQVDVNPAQIHAADGAVQRVLGGFLLGVVVADGSTPFHGSGLADHARLVQQNFGEGGFAGARVTHERDVANVRRGIGHS